MMVIGHDPEAALALRTLATALDALADDLAGVARVLRDQGLHASQGWSGPSRRWFDDAHQGALTALHRAAVTSRREADAVRHLLAHADPMGSGS